MEREGWVDCCLMRSKTKEWKWVKQTVSTPLQGWSTTTCSTCSALRLFFFFYVCQLGSKNKKKGKRRRTNKVWWSVSFPSVSSQPWRLISDCQYSIFDCLVPTIKTNSKIPTFVDWPMPSSVGSVELNEKKKRKRNITKEFDWIRKSVGQQRKGGCRKISSIVADFKMAVFLFSFFEHENKIK